MLSSACVLFLGARIWVGGWQNGPGSENRLSWRRLDVGAVHRGARLMPSRWGCSLLLGLADGELEAPESWLPHEV